MAVLVAPKLPLLFLSNNFIDLLHVTKIFQFVFPGSRGSPEIIPALTGIDLGLGNDTNNITNTNNENTRLLAVLPVRRENLGHLSRKELAEEAAKVLKQADSVHCVSNRTGENLNLYYPFL